MNNTFDCRELGGRVNPVAILNVIALLEGVKQGLSNLRLYIQQYNKTALTGQI